MPTVKIRNFDAILMKLQRGESALKDELNEKYREAVDNASAEILSGAVQYLNKPNWQLSQSIRKSRIKEYRNRRTIFQAVEAEGSKNPAPNTPGAYAWYQEHGYTVSASAVKRPRSGRLIRPGEKRAAYQRTAPKWFFKRAAETVFPKFREAINKINTETKLKLQ